MGSEAAKSCVCAAGSKQAERRGRRRSQAVRHPRCVGVAGREEQPQVPAAVQHLLRPPGSARCKQWVGGTRTAMHNGVSEKGGNSCHIRWGFVSFVLFLAPAWRAAPTGNLFQGILEAKS